MKLTALAVLASIALAGCVSTDAAEPSTVADPAEIALPEEVAGCQLVGSILKTTVDAVQEQKTLTFDSDAGCELKIRSALSGESAGGYRVEVTSPSDELVHENRGGLTSVSVGDNNNAKEDTVTAEAGTYTIVVTAMAKTTFALSVDVV